MNDLRAERDNALSRVRYVKQLLAHARGLQRQSLVDRLHEAEHRLDKAENALAAELARERQRVA